MKITTMMMPLAIVTATTPSISLAMNVGEKASIKNSWIFADLTKLFENLKWRAENWKLGLIPYYGLIFSLGFFEDIKWFGKKLETLSNEFNLSEKRIGAENFGTFLFDLAKSAIGIAALGSFVHMKFFYNTINPTYTRLWIFLNENH